MISRYPIIGGDVGVKHGVTPPGLTPPYKVRITIVFGRPVILSCFGMFWPGSSNAHNSGSRAATELKPVAKQSAGRDTAF